VLEHPRTPLTRSLPELQKERAASELKSFDDALDAMERIGLSHAAAITIEEDDIKGGKIDTSRVIAQVTKRVGTHAWELQGLRQTFEERLTGLRAGDIVDVSDLYSVAFQYSTQRTNEVADQRAAQAPWGVQSIARDISLLSQARAGEAPEGFGLEGAAGLGLEAYAAAKFAKALKSVGGALVESAPKIGLTGVRRFFYDPRSFRQISRAYWDLRRPVAGRSLHHWLIPQSAKWVPAGIRNAGFNLVELPGMQGVFHPRLGLNQWMGFAKNWGTAARLQATAVDYTIMGGIPAMAGATGYGSYSVTNELLERDEQQQQEEQ